MGATKTIKFIVAYAISFVFNHERTNDHVCKYNVLHYSDWVCTAVVSNDVMKDLRG